LQSGTKNGEVTSIKENAISGLQWSDGRVDWGHTFDDDSSPAKGMKCGFDGWIDECLSKMINPESEEE